MFIQIERGRDNKRPICLVIVDHDEDAPDAETVKALILSAFQSIGFHLRAEQIVRLNEAEKDEGQY